MDDKSFFYYFFYSFFYYKYNNQLQNILNIGFCFVVKLFERLASFLSNAVVFVDVDDIINKEPENMIEKKEEIIKYEDKFLIDIRKMEKEYIFDEIEKQLLEEKITYFLNQILETRQNNIEEINNKICEIRFKYENEILLRDTDSECSDDELTKEEKMEKLLDEKKGLICEISKIEETIDIEKDREQASIMARNFVINKRIEKLENCFIMETTPQGNVLMIYDNKRNSFKFYSDNTIPYRYLEVVGRKYVKMFDCRPLYVDMEEELNLAEERWQKEKEEERKQKEEEKKQKEEQKIVAVEKKSVFAKFKSYNKEGSTGRVNVGVPPKNSITITKEQEKEKILLKEQVNRYTYEGKLANFSFLKKVERKVVDKKYGISFADFKKMQNMSNK
jgi:hypothetical protein